MILKVLHHVSDEVRYAEAAAGRAVKRDAETIFEQVEQLPEWARVVEYTGIDENGLPRTLDLRPITGKGYVRKKQVFDESRGWKIEKEYATLVSKSLNATWDEVLAATRHECAELSEEQLAQNKEIAARNKAREDAARKAEEDELAKRKQALRAWAALNGSELLQARLSNPQWEWEDLARLEFVDSVLQRCKIEGAFSIGENEEASPRRRPSLNEIRFLQFVQESFSNEEWYTGCEIVYLRLGGGEDTPALKISITCPDGEVIERYIKIPAC